MVRFLARLGNAQHRIVGLLLAIAHRRLDPLVRREFAVLRVRHRSHQRLGEIGWRTVRGAQEHENRKCLANASVLLLLAARVDCIHRVLGQRLELRIGERAVRIRGAIEDLFRKALVDVREELWRDRRKDFRENCREIARGRALHRSAVRSVEHRPLHLVIAGHLGNRLIDLG